MATAVTGYIVLAVTNQTGLNLDTGTTANSSKFFDRAAIVGLGGSWGLPKNFTLNANVGRSTFEDGIAKDYTDWNVGVARQFGLFNVGLGYYGTDGNGRDNSGKLADNRVVFTVAVGQ